MDANVREFSQSSPQDYCTVSFKAITSYIGLENVCWVKGIDWYNCHIVPQTPSSPKPRYTTRHPCLHYQGKSTFQSLFQLVFGKAYGLLLHARGGAGYLNKSWKLLMLIYCDFKFRLEHFHKSESFNRPRLPSDSRSDLLCAGSLRRSPASCSTWPAPP